MKGRRRAPSAVLGTRGGACRRDRKPPAMRSGRGRRPRTGLQWDSTYRNAVGHVTRGKESQGNRDVALSNGTDTDGLI